MNITKAIYSIQSAYPRIYHACHADHQANPANGMAISQRDATILAHLTFATPITQTQLARHLGIAKSTMSEAIKYLIAEDLVKREIATDTRAHLLQLTVKGQDIMSRNSVLEAGKLAAVLAHMSDTEVEKALAGLEILAQACLNLTADSQTREDAE